MSVLALFFGLALTNGSLIQDTVEHSRQIDASFKSTAAYVDTYIESNGQLPSQTAFKIWISSHPPSAYGVNGMQLEPLSNSPKIFSLEGPPPKNSYVLRYWRGEWEETYTSWTQKSSTEVEESSYYLFGSRWIQLTLVLLVFVSVLIAAIKVWPRKRRAA